MISYAFYDIFTKSDRYAGRILGSVTILFIWLKLFYLLRIFAPTSQFIRMIIESVKGMSTFLGILFVSIFAFANCFYVLDGGYSGVDVHKASGDSFFLVFAGTYQLGLGEWDTDGYGDSEHTFILWSFFMLSTFLVQIVLFNLLIAIMEDTFDKVSEVKTKALLKEICQLIAENWFLLSSKSFERAKYIVVAEKEKAH